MAKKRVRRKSVSKNSSKDSKIPRELKVISIIFYIGSFFHIIGALLMLFGGIAGTALISALGVDKILELMPNLTQQQVIFATVLSALLIVGAIVTFVMGVLEYYVGRDLMKRRNWARITAIIILLLGLIKSITLLISGNFVSIIGIILYGIASWYLLFHKNIRKIFD